jgi:cytoskeleton protein RodZ
LAFGTELQLERERRAITLASIAEVTKVPQRHLLALEMERFELLPGGIFTKGILRSYCRQVGLNEDEWLQKMPVATTDEPAAEWTQFAENVSRTRAAGMPRMYWRWWGVLLMMLTLSALCWGTWRYVVQPQVGALQLLDAHWLGGAVQQHAAVPPTRQADSISESSTPQ